MLKNKLNYQRFKMSLLLKNVGLSALLIPAVTSALAVTFDGFSDISNLVLNGDTVTTNTNDGTVLRLTSSPNTQSGSSFSKTTVNAKSFSTFFKFRITEPGGSIADCNTKSGADGLVFVVQSVSSSIGGAGQGIGYEGIQNSVGIEFDTWCNAENNDPNSNHVAIDINGNVKHDGALPVQRVLPDFDNGNVWYAWVDYNGKTLEVRVSQTGVRPDSPKIKAQLDIPTILGNVTDAYVGFTSGTGADWGNHDILYWEYRENYQPVEILSGVVNRMQTIAVTCKNVETNQIVEIPSSKLKTWNCEDAGLIGKRGQSAVVTINGKLK
jgi:hypothetical protein